jgi:hypothetical protein
MAAAGLQCPPCAVDHLVHRYSLAECCLITAEDVEECGEDGPRAQASTLMPRGWYSPHNASEKVRTKALVAE